MLQIVKYPHPALRYASRPVTEIDDSLRAAIRAMFELMYAAKGIGLAANQVALPFRFFILNVTADPEQQDKEQVFINPEIVKRHSSTEDEEGCLSLPGLYAKVRRARKIRVRAYDLEGNLVEHEADELLSRAVQHETDHLEGKLFIDYLEPAGASARPATSCARSSSNIARPRKAARFRPTRTSSSGWIRCRGRLATLSCQEMRSAMTDSLRIIMLGTGDFALPTFEHLIETGQTWSHS